MARRRKEEAAPRAAPRGIIAHSVPRAKWSVMWVGKKKGKTRIFETKFEEDLMSAVEKYSDLKARGKRMVTLRCCNMGVAPPKNVTEYEEISWDIVTRKGKKYKKRNVTIINRMRELNKKGIWWCPYCMVFRKFKIAVWEDRHLMECPMCEITTRDGQVKRHNPMASEILDRKRRR